MDIDKWIEEKKSDAADWVVSIDVISVDDLKELLKTHTLVPNDQVQEKSKISVLDKPNMPPHPDSLHKGEVVPSSLKVHDTYVEWESDDKASQENK
jgi:hypothetical protein